jgi:hypothetical protein
MDHSELELRPMNRADADMLAIWAEDELFLSARRLDDEVLGGRTRLSGCDRWKRLPLT